MRSISVVIPVFRSAPILAELYQRLAAVLSPLASDWEIIFVDDASGDGTFERLVELRERDPRVKLVRFARNAGQHHATLCGLQRAAGELVFTMDDDLQNPPEEIPAFIARIDQGYDLVIGKITGGKRHSPLRNLASSAVQALVSLILNKPRELSLSSFRCMTRRTLSGMTSFTGKHVYIPALMLGSTPADRICNVPVSHHARFRGESNYTLRKLFKLFSYLLINHSYLPLRLVSVWGFALSVASIGYAFFIVVKALLFGVKVAGWPSLAVLVSFLSGNVLFGMGILGEYIGRLVDDSSHAAQFPVFEERF